MSQKLRFSSTPELRDPVLVLAYSGWNDGGEAATSAVTELLETFSAERLASLDLEEFIDFTVVRPHVRLGDHDRREIVWPSHEFYSIESSAQDFDVVLGFGVEPHLRWKAYTSSILELVKKAGIRRVLLLGAFLDEAIYSQPIDVLGFSSDPEFAERASLTSTGYEGPTGMIGVLGEALAGAGVPTASLWARLPHYVTRTPNWRGALALLQRLSSILDLPLDLSKLEGRAGEFDEIVSEAIGSDPQLSAYVRELKRRAFSQ